MRKLKICYLADWKSIHTQRWLRFFADQGHQIDLVSVDPEPCKEFEGIRLHSLNFRNENILFKVSYRLYVFLRLFRLKRILSKIKPDILHAHFVSDYGWWGAKTSFKPFVLTAWGSDIFIAPKNSEQVRKNVVYALQKADLITSDAESLRRAIISLGASEKNNYVIQWGVDLKHFNPDVKCDELREKLGLDNSLVVLSPRSFTPLYNIDVIIKSIPLVMREIPNAIFILMRGYGNKETENELKSLAQELRVENNIQFVDFVSREEVPQYYKLADILVSVPSSDATPISLLEGIACGAAPIISDLPSPRELIKDGENGFVVPVRDAQAIATAIVRLLKDDVTRSLFSHRNITLIKEKADHNKHMRHMEELYYEIKKTI